MVKLGFTGTRHGATRKQIMVCRQIIFDYQPSEFHDGACVGADFQIHNVAREFGVKTVSHPPKNPTLRAKYETDVVLPEKDYLERDIDIVEDTDEIIATPKGYKEELRSGTWFTIRQALKRNKKVTIVYPDGRIEIREKKKDINNYVKQDGKMPDINLGGLMSK